MENKNAYRSTDNIGFNKLHWSFGVGYWDRQKVHPVETISFVERGCLILSFEIVHAQIHLHICLIAGTTPLLSPETRASSQLLIDEPPEALIAAL